jgi:hypothetical protein
MCLERTPSKSEILDGDSYARFDSVSCHRLLSVTGVLSVWEELSPSHTLVNFELVNIAYQYLAPML